MTTTRRTSSGSGRRTRGRKKFRAASVKPAKKKTQSKRPRSLLPTYTPTEDGTVLRFVASITFDDETGKHVARIPCLPGCYGIGATREGAVEDVRVALTDILEVHKERKSRPIYEEPDEPVDESTLETVDVRDR